MRRRMALPKYFPAHGGQAVRKSRGACAPGTAQGGATVITRLAQGQRQGEAGFKIGPTDEEAASAAVAASD
jgi:hypothetical protein